MRNQMKYPVGVQSFSEIRENGYVYIDKTNYVYDLTHTPAKYYFLSRPRRFGKTLLTDTFHCYFEGRRELFEGLAIDSLEKDWTEYPVIHFDLSRGKGLDEQSLTSTLNSILESNEKRLGVVGESVDLNIRVNNLIVSAYEKYGKQVVVLVDEYDAPLLDVAHDDDLLLNLRQIMRNFYSPLKGCHKYLRFVFLTGITKFSQLSIFSELNNMVNISMDDEYAAICGITDTELHTDMDDDVAMLASALKVEKTTMYSMLKEYYDGYHFSEESPDIYNPFSLLQAMDKRKIKPYWFESGTPTFMLNLLAKHNFDPTELDLIYLDITSFDVALEQSQSVYPLLYQSGYISINSYDALSELYCLGFPNQEVRLGLMKSLLQNYLGPNADMAKTVVGRMRASLLSDDIDGALRLLQTFLGTVPYCRDTHYEGHYQQMLYIIFTLLGAECRVEERTQKGRIDMVLKNTKRIFVIEIKVDESAQAALDQIEEKQYAARFALDPLPVTRVGVNFSTEERNITEWIVR